MPTRQHQRWLFTDPRLEPLEPVLARLPRGAGVVVRHHHLPPAERRRLLDRLARVARRRGLLLVDEARGQVARIHDCRELRRALGRNVPLIFVSSLHRTRSHPERTPLPRMRAATLARLAGGRALALGGMDARHYRRVERLGFNGWGAIDAWRVRT
ncbi:thiamine phosphate synthase [Sphingomonas ginkgonis]|uniref:Thiamine phosphate synthase n=1 Tax=Sphingomonas ginkgonis TaxID=2315330 RepID=A0A429V742_9SPHN|nr:thiamine phosphate synthase [Sphingomonas ginkgonis]RST29744.1 thiamine phosphate synthase [Sphingomonas ginkgonis]